METNLIGTVFSYVCEYSGATITERISKRLTLGYGSVELYQCDSCAVYQYSFIERYIKE